MVLVDVSKDYTNKLGKIKVANSEFVLGDIPRMFFRLAFIPTDVEIYNQYILYTGYSIWFDGLGEGEVVPEYIINMRGIGADFVVESVKRLEAK